MKYLQDYMEDRQTALFKKTDTFFAFSTSQFNEQKKEDVKYVAMGGGMVCNKEHVKELVEGLDLIWKESVAQDIADHGMPAIIKRELANHEAYYTGDTESTFEALKGYPVTKEQIYKIYRNKNAGLDMVFVNRETKEA